MVGGALTPPLPFDAPLHGYARRADALLDAVRGGDPDARSRFKWEHPRFRDLPLSAVDGPTLGPDDARLVVAREHGFETWERLASFVEAVQGDPAVARFEEAADAVVGGDVERLASLLRDDPGLARARSTRRHHATLLHYVAANGVERGRQRTPPEAVEVARLLLEAGADPDALADMYDAHCTTMSMLVSSEPPAAAGLQAALAETLLDHGAALEGPGTRWRSAVATALVFGYPDTAEALARRGPPVEDLPTAAGLGRLDDVAGLLPDAPAPARHAALALAAQLGRAEVVATLLDAGEDPDRLNPEGHHAHATPLHQAVAGGHLDVVRLLAERGARLDRRDTVFEGTPLDWALHLGKDAIADYLRERSGKRDRPGA